MMTRVVANQTHFFRRLMNCRSRSCLTSSWDICSRENAYTPSFASTNHDLLAPKRPAVTNRQSTEVISSFASVLSSQFTIQITRQESWLCNHASTVFFPSIVFFVSRSQLIDFFIVNLIPEMIAGFGALIMISPCSYLACIMKEERKKLWNHGPQCTNT